MQSNKPKIFFIGFNKTGTTSFHHFFSRQGHKSFHHNAIIENKRVYLGKIIQENIANGKKVLDNIDTYMVYSDFCFCTESVYYEATTNFKLLKKQYPNSYFILQTRNEDEWIQSRLKHKSGNQSFNDRVTKLLQMNTEELVMHWRHFRRNLHTEIINYFGNSEKFMVFDMNKNSINTLINFLSPDYILDPTFWKKYNATK